MSLTKAEVKHIAELARLDLSEAEISDYCQQLSDILDHVQRLQELDTRNISPTASVLGELSMLREDETQDGLTHKQLAQNAPEMEKNQYKVPPVLE